MTASLKHNGSSGASGTGLLSGDFDYDDLTERQDSEQIFPTLLEREDYEWTTVSTLDDSDISSFIFTFNLYTILKNKY